MTSKVLRAGVARCARRTSSVQCYSRTRAARRALFHFTCIVYVALSYTYIDIMSDKYCAVPMCSNSTVKTPNKLFFVIPKNAKRRKRWMTAMKRADPIGPKTVAFCCEDHFDIEKDMENYVKYKLVGGRLILKENVCPHKFSCQQQRDIKSERSVVQKRRQKELIHKILHEDIPNQMTSENIEEIYIVGPGQEQEPKTEPSDPLKVDEEIQNELHKCEKRSKKVQVCIKNKTNDKSTMTDKKYCGTLADSRNSNLKLAVRENKNVINEDSFSMTSSITSKEWDMDPADATDSENADLDNLMFKKQMASCSLLCISRKPELFLGLPKHCYFCIDLLSIHGKCAYRDVMITLKKIRLHHSNALLALDFGLSSSSIRTIFRKTVPAIALCMKTIIFFPNPSAVLTNLPITFRKKYSNVQSIIDCLEIQIDKPSNAVQQALTWSEYKSCYTIKYLISITPDGLINYISEGYGGRTSDALIFQDCDILDLLPDKSAVLADRGFKNISHLLQQKGHVLIRPQSVSSGTTPTKSEVLETKRIAALRIHVESSIGRLRRFGFLMPHACVDLKQVDILDLVLVIACGIVNLQNPLFDLSNDGRNE